MPHIKIDGSNNRVLRTMSDRMDLGPNGPKAITSVGIALAMFVLLMTVRPELVTGIGRNGPMSFAPLLVFGIWGTGLARSVLRARQTVDEGWRD